MRLGTLHFGVVGEDRVVRIAAPDARRLHRAGGRKIGRAKADAVQARRCRGDLLDIVDAFGRFQDRVDQDRPGNAVLRLKLGEQPVKIVDVGDALGLGQHDDFELVADRADNFDDIVERPWRIERIDAHP